jgi:hypothetical protein
MKNKFIRLTESDLHRIVKESVNNVLKENEQFSQDFDADTIARWILKNGFNVYKFTDQIEEAYEMLQYDSNPMVKLAKAIRSSNNFCNDASEEYGYQAGDAPLAKPIFGKRKIDVIGYKLNNGNLEFYGYSTYDSEWYDNIKITDEQIPQIIRLIK